jgi:hypothetical protein
VIGILLAVGSIGQVAAMELTSPDLKEGATIAMEQVHALCGGTNISPALRWSGAPKETKSIAVTMIDVSVKPSGWSHWLVMNLPPGATALAKGAQRLPAGARQLVTDFGDAQYGGPCPPPGSGPHRYQFTVWALRSEPLLPARASTNDIKAALDKLALAKTTLTGSYER